MAYQESFEILKKKVETIEVSKIKGHFAYQFNIVGEDEGIFYVEITDGSIVAQPYDYIDNDATLIASFADFEKFFDGADSSVSVSGDASVLEGAIKATAAKKAEKKTETKSAAKTTAKTEKKSATSTTKTSAKSSTTTKTATKKKSK
jgi:hypothetical protein